MAFFSRFRTLFNTGSNDGSKKSEKNNSNKKVSQATSKTTSAKKATTPNERSEEENTAPASSTNNSVSPHLIPSTIIGKIRTKKSSAHKTANPRRVGSVGGGLKKKKPPAIKEKPKPKQLKSLRKVKSGSMREGDDKFPEEAKSRRDVGKNSAKKSSTRTAESPRQGKRKKKKSKRSHNNTAVTTQQATTTQQVDEHIIFADEPPVKAVTPVTPKPVKVRRRTSDTASSHINSVVKNSDVETSNVECLPLKSRMASQRGSQRNSDRDLEAKNENVKADDPAIKELEPVVEKEQPEEAMNREVMNKLISELTPENRAFDNTNHDPWLDLKILQERDKTIYSRQQTRLNTAATYSFFADNELCSVKHETTRAEKVEIKGPITRRTFSVINRDRQVDDVIDLQDIRMMPTQVTSGEQLQVSAAFQLQQPKQTQKDPNASSSTSQSASTTRSQTSIGTPARIATPKTPRDK